MKPPSSQRSFTCRLPTKPSVRTITTSPGCRVTAPAPTIIIAALFGSLLISEAPCHFEGFFQSFLHGRYRHLHFGAVRRLTQGGEETVHWHPILSPKEEIVRTVFLSLRNVCHCRWTAVPAGVQTSRAFLSSANLPIIRINGLVHALDLSVGLGVIRRGSELVHTIQLTEVCNKMACKGLPLITD